MHAAVFKMRTTVGYVILLSNDPTARENRRMKMKESRPQEQRTWSSKRQWNLVNDWKWVYMKGHHIHYIEKIPYSDIGSDVDKYKSGKMTSSTLIDSTFIPEIRNKSHADTEVWWEGTADQMYKKERMENELTRKVVGLPTSLTVDACHPHVWSRCPVLLVLIFLWPSSAAEKEYKTVFPKLPF